MLPASPPAPVTGRRRVRTRALDDGVRTQAAAALGGVAARRPGQVLPFLGPALVASIAYVDPGNFATNIQAGSAFGYRLVWVVVLANVTGMFVQTLSAKLGAATGLNLCEVMAARWSRPATLASWLGAEVVAMATDLAELLGAAIGCNLLFGLPLWLGALLCGATTWVVLNLHRHGFRLVEALIGALLGVIALCYLVETVIGRPDLAAAGGSFLPPRLGSQEATLLATGILGATVMPHVIYLHSALTQGRVDRPTTAAGRRRLVRLQTVDVVVAMAVAGSVNAAMLLMAARTFWTTGRTGVASIEEAHRTLEPLLGRTSALLFGVSLLVSGIASSVVGTLAGQVIMGGFLARSVPLWVRRLATMAPAFVVIAVGADPTRALVWSQVVLSFGIPFALVPLVAFTARRSIMGDLRNHVVTTAVAAVVAGGIVALNVVLVIRLLG